MLDIDEAASNWQIYKNLTNETFTSKYSVEIYQLDPILWLSKAIFKLILSFFWTEKSTFSQWFFWRKMIFCIFCILCSLASVLIKQNMTWCYLSALFFLFNVLYRLLFAMIEYSTYVDWITALNNVIQQLLLIQTAGNLCQLHLHQPITLKNTNHECTRCPLSKSH